MKHRTFILTVLLTLASTARAQQPGSDAAVSNYLRRSYAAFSKNLVAVVAMMPEPDFRFRPEGAAKEVRTFGEIVAHIVFVNAFACAMGDGKENSAPATDSTLPFDKTRLVALMNETNTRCTAYFATLTDSMLGRTILTKSAGRDMQSSHGVAAIFALTHSNEHYGNLVTYLRAKGLVPPAAAAQAGPVALLPSPKP